VTQEAYLRAYKGLHRFRGDPVHPGGELGVAAEAVESFVRPQVGLLGHVSRIFLVAGQAEGERVDIRVRRSDQPLESGSITGLSGGDQLVQVDRHLLVPTRPTPATLRSAVTA